LLAAKKGLESKDKKYFEQLIACDNYLYFKNMMVRRNFQLEDQAMKLMQQKIDKDNNEEDIKEFEIDPEWKKKKEEIELECAIQMSLALEEEKRRLLALEEEELLVYNIY
jgi:hypothetical protein